MVWPATGYKVISEGRLVYDVIVWPATGCKGRKMHFKENLLKKGQIGPYLPHFSDYIKNRKNGTVT